MKKALKKRGNLLESKRVHPQLDSFRKVNIFPKSKRSDSRSEPVIKKFGLPGSKRSQLTVFIILGLILVIVIILLFLNRGLLIKGGVGKIYSISDIKTCIEGDANEAGSLKNLTTILKMQGGAIEPKNYYLYQGYKVDYLCYINEYYKTCVMQKPLLKESIQKELEINLKPRVKNCLDYAKSSLEKNGYTINSNEPNITVELIPGNILVNIDLDLVIKKQQVQSYKSIKIGMNSKLYELSMIAGSISKWETKFGDSEIMSYMLYYPDLKVEKKKQGDGTKIYILTYRDSGEKFIFASRSYVIPPGITGN